MYASHGVPMEASTDGRSKKFAITIAQSERRSASGDRIILPFSSMSEVLGIKTVLLSATCSGTAPPSNRYFSALKRNWEPSHPHTYRRHTEFHQGQVQNLSSKQYIHQIQYDQWSNGYRQEVSEHTARYLRTGDASGPRHGLEKCVEVEEVVSVLTPFVGGVAQDFHVLLVELRLLLAAEVEEGDRQEES